MLELTAHTEAGARLVQLAETLAQELARRAPDADRAYDVLGDVAPGRDHALH